MSDEQKKQKEQFFEKERDNAVKKARERRLADIRVSRSHTTVLINNIRTIQYILIRLIVALIFIGRFFLLFSIS